MAKKKKKQQQQQEQQQQQQQKGAKGKGKRRAEAAATERVRAPKRDLLDGRAPDLRAKGVSLPLVPPLDPDSTATAASATGAEVTGDDKNHHEVSVENAAAFLSHVKLDLERFAVLRDLIFAVPRCLSPEECAAWIAWGEKRGFASAKQASSAGFAFRDNGRISVHDPEVAAIIFQRLRGVVPAEIDGRKAVGCSPNIRLYRYATGQRFGKHIDESNFEQDLDAWSEFTLLFYLNDEGLDGGETVFYSGNTGTKEALRVPPAQGLALLHWHGDRCLVHEGANVRAGVKYLLRSDVLLLYTQLLPDVFSSRLPVPLVISVGNVSVGGTGKTPMVEFIGRTLANGNEPKSFGSDCMILMRGYGRDEEFELKANLPAAKIVAGSNRAQLAQEALCESATSSDNVSTIILDDGLQHFQLKRDLNVVMVNALRGCAGAYAHTLPYGALREPWASGLARADAVVLHHATSVSAQGLVALRDALAKIQPDLRFFASEMRPVSLYQGEMPSRIICLTGVGCPESVERMAQRVFARGGKTPEIEMCVFGDHHACG
ncbi:Tetraacyldisaccharide 4'-kinase [Hondaea fermentalgiana]|uniref:tetraacyldisaccharide 4'-kinase n=1 Tax=Hondaea fermentalgiana TaxID=2315210 RepID=A0A2R5GIH8_9STRA|nr:Tetraacyldisaccharide 4'-kinase [Hondaea fermentalgiana]|eukprot:GBG30697.1 Tetraacyldisaccharide 4'-kinase [Hondaea fermentalgiana]